MIPPLDRIATTISILTILGIVASSFLLVSIPLALAQGNPIAEPQTVPEIMKMNPMDFTQLQPGAAVGALSKLAFAGEFKKLNELLNAYSSRLFGQPVQFSVETLKDISIEGLRSPQGNFLDFGSVRDLLASHPGQQAQIIAKDNGFEIQLTGTGRTTTFSAQGFRAVSFSKDGAAILDGNRLKPEEGLTTSAMIAKDGSLILKGKGTFTPRGGEQIDFQGASRVLTGGEIMVDFDQAGRNWVRVKGQRVIPKDSTVVVFTDPNAFSQTTNVQKVLITNKDGTPTIIAGPTRMEEGVRVPGAFDIGRQVAVIGSDGKPVLKEETIPYSQGTSRIRTTPEQTFDSFFQQLDAAASRRGTYLRQGRDNNPSLVDGLQRLLAIQEHDNTGSAIYGPKTKAAVQAFQAANGISTDGIVGPNTYRKLSDAFDTHPSAQFQYQDFGGAITTITDSGASRESNGRKTAAVPRVQTKPAPSHRPDYIGDVEDAVSGFGHKGCYAASNKLRRVMGWPKAPSPNRIAAAGEPETGTFWEGRYQQVPLPDVRIGDPVYFAAANHGDGGVTHIATVVRLTENPSDPVIAHSFSGSPRVERLSEFRRSFRGGGQGWDRAKVFTYSRVTSEFAQG